MKRLCACEREGVAEPCLHDLLTLQAVGNLARFCDRDLGNLPFAVANAGRRLKGLDAEAARTVIRRIRREAYDGQQDEQGKDPRHTRGVSWRAPPYHT